MQLTPEHVQQFEDEGYLVVRGALEAADLEPVIAEYEATIDRRAAELLAAGKISDPHTAAPFDRRLALICRECNEMYPELDIMRRRGRATFDFLRHEHLLDMVEAFVGPEITCSPIQHVRPKLPGGLAPAGSDPHVVPWHQDAGVTWPEADPYFILTVWLPLSPATPENGCLQIIPRTHGRGLVEHESRPGVGTTITDAAMPAGQVVTLPMDRGDVLFLHKEVPHRSLPNASETIRWSMDLRYQTTGAPTGRPFHPDFVVRSAAHPETVLTDWATWDRLWAEALERSARAGVRAHRWTEPSSS